MAARAGGRGFGALKGGVSGPVFWFSSPERRLAPVLLLCGRTSPLEPGEALEVIGEVGHADLGAGKGLCQWCG